MIVDKTCASVQTTVILVGSEWLPGDAAAAAAIAKSGGYHRETFSP